MATIEIDVKLPELMSKLGCSANLIEAVQAAHLVADYSLKGVVILITANTVLKEPTGALQISQIAPIKLGVLQALINGTLHGGASKNLAKIGLEKAVKQVLSHVKVDVKPPAFLHKPNELHVKYPGEVNSPKEDWVDMVTANPGMPPILDLSKVMQAKVELEVEHVFTMDNEPVIVDSSIPETLKAELKKVKLINATDLYQPVAGSNQESIYFAIAIRKDLKIAVRIRDVEHISIRAEGTGLNTYGPRLAEAGMSADISGNKPHYSVHLSAGSVDLTRKAIGAVLFGVNLPFTKITTDLDPIWGKGV